MFHITVASWGDYRYVSHPHSIGIITPRRNKFVVPAHEIHGVTEVEMMKMPNYGHVEPNDVAAYIIRNKIR